MHGILLTQLNYFYQASSLKLYSTTYLLSLAFILIDYIVERITCRLGNFNAIMIRWRLFNVLFVVLAVGLVLGRVPLTLGGDDWNELVALIATSAGRSIRRTALRRIHVHGRHFALATDRPTRRMFGSRFH